MWTTLNQPRGRRVHRYPHTTLDGTLQQQEAAKRIHDVLCDTHVHVARARAGTSRHTHLRALDRVYAVHQRGVLALCRMWVSSLSHTSLFLHNQDAYIRPVGRRAAARTSAFVRAQESRRATIYIYIYICTQRTPRDGKCNQCTNLRRSPLERGRPVPALGTRRLARTYSLTCVRLCRECKSAAIGREATQTRLSRMSFFEFRTTSTLRAIFSVCLRDIPRTHYFIFLYEQALILSLLSNGLCTSF